MESSTYGESSGESPQGTPSSSQQDQTLGERLREDGRQRIDATRRGAAQKVEGLAEAVDAASSRLSSVQPTLAQYTANMADGIERLATKLRDSSLDELAADARRFAARNPALFLLGSAAVGVVLARYFKLSVSEQESGTTSASSARAGTH